MHKLSAALLLVVALAGAGCDHATTHVRMLSADQLDSFSTSDVVVEGHVMRAYGRSNLTLAEDLEPGGEPEDPRNGYMTVFTLNVDKKIKGISAPAELQLKANDPQSLETNRPRVFRGALAGVGTGALLRIGWRETLGVRSDMKILVLNQEQQP